MSNENVTGKVCSRCHELLDDCLYDEEPRVQEWEDVNDGQPQPD